MYHAFTSCLTTSRRSAGALLALIFLPASVSLAQEPAAKPTVSQEYDRGVSLPLSQMVSFHTSHFTNGNCTTPPPPGQGQVPAVIAVDCDGMAAIPPSTWLYSDSNGAVGTTQYVQRANPNIQIFNKATGLSVLGPFPSDTIFAGMSNACATSNEGDPVVKFDQLAGRWVFLSKATPNGGPNLLCIAVSQTSDATGAYYTYAYTTTSALFPDYPKLGVWSDAYYITRDDLDPVHGFGFHNSTVCALNRSNMLVGQGAQQICFSNKSNKYHSLLPADLDGGTPPPAGTPNYQLCLGGLQSLVEYTFHVNFANPSQSTFTGPTFVGVTTFGHPCAPTVHLCVPQPGTTQLLDPLYDRLMYRLAYRNFGSYQSMVVNHTIGSSNLGSLIAGIRWYELRVAQNGTLGVYQSGTYQPDSTWRWEGSLAMDKVGNMALGYNESSSSIYPSIAFTGRLPGDALGTMEGEQLIYKGTASQFSPTQFDARWGYYTSVALDPVDDCTMWYTAEYMSTPGVHDWNTRIASFKFPTCH